MDFLQIVWSIVLIIVFFGGSIFVHELGHYLAARRRGLKVERFSIGFGPKLWSTTRDGVEWCVSLFPLGGYVALPQLAHLEGVEGKYNSDKPEKPLPPISYTDTLVVAVMGVVFNMIFAFALGCLLWVVGKPSTDSEQTTTVGTVLQSITTVDGQSIDGPGFVAGLRPLDKIVAIDGMPVANWRDIKQYVITGTGRNEAKKPQATLTIEREGQTLSIQATPILNGPEKLRSLGILPMEELFVGRVFPHSPALAKGVQTGDRIVSINNQPIRTFYDFSQISKNLGSEEVALGLMRDGAEFTVGITPQKATIDKTGDTRPLLGFALEPKIVTLYHDPFRQISDAASLAFRTLSSLVNPSSDIKLNHLSGPPGIAWVIHRLSFDIRQVLSFVLIINVNLAILNMLPLPVLDGGHIVLATINKIRRKPISVSLISAFQNVFTVLLLGLMVYVIFFSDIPRVKREWSEEQKAQKLTKDRIEPVFAPTPSAE